MLSRRRFWLAVFGCWTVFGLLESSKAYVTVVLQRGEHSVWTALAGNMPWWYGWALLTPVVIWAVRRFPLDTPRWLANAGVHLAIGVACSLVHLAVIGFLYYHTIIRHTLERMGATRSPLTTIRNWIDNFLVADTVMYFAIVGALYALEFYRRYRAGEAVAARLQLQSARLEASMTEARLAALRMELNPHFLFNTLNAIAGLVRRRDNDDAVTMLARLGDLLRLTLGRDLPQEVPLDRELEILGGYLDIESVRFGDRLRVVVDVPAAERRALVPALVLQPLAENAVRHGIAQVPGEGTVTIRAYRDGDSLAVEVIDTGAGFAPTEQDGVGLTNTRERLARLYGAAGGLTVARRNGETVVRMFIPYRPAPDYPPAAVSEPELIDVR